jgi:hypothetical protein
MKRSAMYLGTTSSGVWRFKVADNLVAAHDKQFAASRDRA